MKTINKTIISCLLCAIALIAVGKCANAQLKKDKVYHSASGVILSTGVVITQKYIFKKESNPIWPTLTVCFVAAAKEMYDSMNGGYFSKSDFAVTAISGALANMLFAVILKPNKKKPNKIDPFDWENDPLKSSSPGIN